MDKPRFITQKNRAFSNSIRFLGFNERDSKSIRKAGLKPVVFVFDSLLSDEFHKMTHRADCIGCNSSKK